MQFSRINTDFLGFGLPIDAGLFASSCANCTVARIVDLRDIISGWAEYCEKNTGFFHAKKLQRELRQAFSTKTIEQGLSRFTVL
jgi:hypothetical protein